MKIIGEETISGEIIETLEQFIEDICDRINAVRNLVMDENNKEKQLAYLIGFLKGFSDRLNRVCERK